MATRRIGVFLLLMWISGSAAADGQLSFVLNGLSYHFPSHPGYNEKNTGYGLQYDHALAQRHRIVAGLGTFTDSYFSDARYIGAGYTYRLTEFRVGLRRFHVDAGSVLMIAQSAGYRQHYGMDLVATPLPFVSIGTDRAALNTMYTPALYGAYANVLSLQLKLTLF